MNAGTTGSVQVGSFTLALGGAGGTVVQSSSTATAEGTGTLAQALVELEPKQPGKVEAATETIEDASGVTAKCERAVTLSKGVSEGKVFDPDQLGAEVGALLDLVEKLDRKGRHKEALKVARALATLLMLLRRWQKLLQTLRAALGIAEKLGDLDATAWARNELGALRLAAGDVKGAERDLHEAREIRERIGDRRGLATTNRNLGALCEQLQQMVRKEELIQRGPALEDQSRHPPRLRLLGLAVLLALFFGAGVVAANLGDTSHPADFERGTGESGSGGNPGEGDGGKDGKKQDRGGKRKTSGGGDAGPFLLTIQLRGKGSGTVVVDEEGECASGICEDNYSAGEQVTLRGEAARGFVFEGFSGACEGTGACTVTMSAARTVTATFAPIEEEEEEEEETTEEEPPEEPEEATTGEEEPEGSG